MDSEDQGVEQQCSISSAPVNGASHNNDEDSNNDDDSHDNDENSHDNEENSINNDGHSHNNDEDSQNNDSSQFRKLANPMAVELLEDSLAASSMPPTECQEQEGNSDSNRNADFEIFKNLRKQYEGEHVVYIKKEKDSDMSNDEDCEQPPVAMGAIFPVKVEVVLDNSPVGQPIDILPINVTPTSGKKRGRPKGSKNKTGQTTPKGKPSSVKKLELKQGRQKPAKATARKSTAKRSVGLQMSRGKAANERSPAKKASLTKSGLKRNADPKSNVPKRGRPVGKKRGSSGLGKDGGAPKKLKKKTEKKEKTCSVCQRVFVRMEFYERHIAMHDLMGKKNVLEQGENSEGGNPKKRRGQRKAGKVVLPFKVKSKPMDFYCSVCNKTFGKKSALLLHKRSHVVERMKCKICDKTFPSYGLLYSHKWAEHRDLVGHPCEVCSKKFRRKSDLTYHFRVHSGEKPHLCPECGQSFARTKDLLEHRRRQHTGEKPYMCSECGATFAASSAFAAHKKRHLLSPYPCTRCQKKFSDEGLLQLHMQLHEDQVVYACDRCEKTFVNERSLAVHIKDKHSGNVIKKTFECTVCNKSFSRPFGLKSHMYSHLESKPFKCSICDKSFTVKSHLATHMRGHGLNAYQCNLCTVSFPYDSDLQVHKKTVHEGIIFGKGFSCDKCYKTFTRASGLKRHHLVHTGVKDFVCDLCGKACKTTSELGQHMKCHSGVKPYLCPYCGKAFTFNGNLTVHLRVHTGETPFECGVCGKMFNQKSNLDTHSIRKHGLAVPRMSCPRTASLTPFVEEVSPTPFVEEVSPTPFVEEASPTPFVEEVVEEVDDPPQTVQDLSVPGTMVTDI